MQATRPPTSRRDGERRGKPLCLPGATTPHPASNKPNLCHQASLQVSDTINTWLLQRKRLRDTDPCARPLPASPRLGSFPHSRPSSTKTEEAVGTHLVACGGRGGSQGQGLGSRGRRVWLGEQLLGLGEGSSPNKGPHLGFHNDISRGQAQPSAVQMGKLRRRVLGSLEGRARLQFFRPTHLPTRWPWSWSTLLTVTRPRQEEHKAAGSPGCRAPSISDTPEGTPSHCPLSLAHMARKAHF